MFPRFVPLALSLAACISPTKSSLPPGRIEPREIQAHVDFLAADALEGRHAPSAGARAAAAYVAEHFAAAGLEPCGDSGTWFQDVPGLAPNVVGRLPGTSARTLVLSAHYDHLRPAADGEDRIFNGADDNASGTATMLALARALAADPPGGASVVFVAFTGEEMGLVGSRWFVEHPPVRLEDVVANLNLDMVSRGEEDLIFCEAGPGGEFLVSAAVAANDELGGLRLRIGEHPEWLRQSDHAAFIDAGIPAIYFGVEDHPDYHRVTDHADRILPALAARVGRLVLVMTEALARAEAGR